jgi:hypothetical protein
MSRGSLTGVLSGVLDLALGIALLIAIGLIAAAGIGGGTYLITGPNRVVGNDYSSPWRPILVVALRLAGAVMVGVALVVLYLTFWTVACGPCSGR